jgi:hypothetical protein
MIDEGFYFFDNGSFGEIRGFKLYELPDSDKQILKDENSRTALSSFEPPKGLSPSEYTSLFQAEFQKSRRQIDEEQIKIPFIVQVQVGNSESLAELEMYEQNPKFLGWEQPDIVQMFKTYSNNYLNGK